MIKRREFIAGVGGAAVWPLAVRAQQAERMRRIGVLMNADETALVYQAYLTAFAQGLRNLGWIEGQNLRIEVRWNAGDAERARTFATELLRPSPDVILASSTTNLTVLLRQGPTMPIVFVLVSDPVTQGFVSNLARPGGNVTGFSNYEFSIGGKWIDLLKQIAPGVARVAIVFNPDTSPQSRLFVNSIQTAARRLGVESMSAPVRDVADIEHAFESASRQTNTGLIFPPDAFLMLHGSLIVDLAIRQRMPAMTAQPTLVKMGALMSYGPEYETQFRQAAIYVDRILKGTKPGDLPVQAPTKFAFVINMKTAKALGLTIPETLLATADEVIQ
jgi:putative tryptophan/tyrosine transport system substrate-binding protein